MAAEAGDQGLVCPGCQTVISSLSGPCPHCNLEVAWIAQVPAFRDALQVGSHRRTYELEIQASWPGGQIEVRCAVPGHCELVIPPEGRVRLQLDAVGSMLQLQHADGSHQLSLPGELVLHGWRIQARVVAVAPPASSSPQITSFRPGVIALRDRRSTVFGRFIDEQSQSVQVADPEIELRHCVIAYQSNSRQYWIADLGSRQGTFVNRRRILSRRLESGDVVQLGGFGWSFSEEDGFLIPLQGIGGLSLQIEDVRLRHQPTALRLAIVAGEFISIMGPSGAGKSTLLKAILGIPGAAASGIIRADGEDIAEDPAQFRNRVGYVSQQPVIHQELNAVEALQYSALFRTGKPADLQVLRQVDLPEDRWHAPLSKLSGGEMNRVRTAVELVAAPQLLLLDEPASGLDADREHRLLNLLRGLSIQGCTVVMVTHNLDRREIFDRVIELDGQGRLVGDSVPCHKTIEVPANDPATTDAKQLTPREQPSTALSKESSRQRFVRQFWIAVDREWTLLRHDSLRRLLLPVLIVPALFAAALHIAVPPHERPLLGFLALLSCIWMGSSLSLMTIVNERSILDHERVLYMRIGPYLLAKTLSLWCLSLCQTLLFLSTFSALRQWSGVGGMLYGPVLVGVVLSLVGCAAVGMGLLISAAVRHSKSAANFILPLVMIGQIVFSVQVAGNAVQHPRLHMAYGEFHVHGCEGVRGCRNRAQCWLAGDSAGWLCEACEEVFRRQQVQPRNEGGAVGGPGQDWTSIVPEQEQRLSRAIPSDRDRPSGAAALLSHLTISRYGDIALRSFAYFESDAEVFRHGGRADEVQNVYSYRHWFAAAISILLVQVLAFPAAAAAILVRQATER